MSEEIKRRIEIDKELYSCAFEFADGSTFDDGCNCYNDRLALYEQNKDLEERIEKTLSIVNENLVRLSNWNNTGVKLESVIREYKDLKEILEKKEH